VRDVLERMRVLQRPANDDFVGRSLGRKAIFAVPFEPDHHFVSRETLSSAIEHQLERYRRAVLYGMGGTG
jgi:hypothetical protein